MGRGGGDNDDDRERSRKRRNTPSLHSLSARLDEKSGKGKRSRDDDERDRRKEKKDKKHRKTHKSSRSHDEKGAEGSLKGKKHKKSRKVSHSLQIEKISSNDYFLKNNEFSTWLKEEKDIFFSDLSSTQARELFSKFLEDWNKGKLDSQYYEGITRGQRTAHNWKIAPTG